MKLVLSNQSVHTTFAALEESYVGMRSRGDISKYPIFASAMIGSAAMHTIIYVGIILYEGVILQQERKTQPESPVVLPSPKKNNSRILIVDDEPDVALSLKKALADNGFDRVATINDPLLALRNFKPDLYDLLILDIVMPQMDGFALYREIKEIDNRVKVCFITAFEVNYQALRVLFPTVTTTDDIGCFIRKPIEGKTLVKHVEAELN